MARVGACLTSSSRLFRSFGPRKDIALCPLLVFRKGIERSVSVFLSSLAFRVDFFSNKLERYPGTRPFSDWYIVVAVADQTGTVRGRIERVEMSLKRGFHMIITVIVSICRRLIGDTSPKRRRLLRSYGSQA